MFCSSLFSENSFSHDNNNSLNPLRFKTSVSSLADGDEVWGQCILKLWRDRWLANSVYSIPGCLPIYITLVNIDMTENVFIYDMMMTLDASVIFNWLLFFIFPLIFHWSFSKLGPAYILCLFWLMGNLNLIPSPNVGLSHKLSDMLRSI